MAFDFPRRRGRAAVCCIGEAQAIDKVVEVVKLLQADCETERVCQLRRQPPISREPLKSGPKHALIPALPQDGRGEQ